MKFQDGFFYLSLPQCLAFEENPALYSESKTHVKTLTRSRLHVALLSFLLVDFLGSTAIEEEDKVRLITTLSPSIIICVNGLLI